MASRRLLFHVKHQSRHGGGREGTALVVRASRLKGDESSGGRGDGSLRPNTSYESLFHVKHRFATEWGIGKSVVRAGCLGDTSGRVGAKTARCDRTVHWGAAVSRESSEREDEAGQDHASGTSA